MEVEKGLISVEISNGGGERGLGWLGLTASLDQWRWRSVVAGPDQWCWLGFFFGLQVVGRYRFSGSKGVGSVMEVVNGNLLYLVAKKMVNKMLFVYLLLI